MKGLTVALAMLATVLSGCAGERKEPSDPNAQDATRPAMEDFATAWEKMKSDPAFVRSRIADDFKIIEHFDLMGSDWEGTSRTTACTVEQLRNKKWDRLPGRDELVREGLDYLPPEPKGDGQVTVRLHVPESDSFYSDYNFTLSAGRWLWSSNDWYYQQGPEDPLPPSPCPPG